MFFIIIKKCKIFISVFCVSYKTLQKKNIFNILDYAIHFFFAACLYYFCAFIFNLGKNVPINTIKFNSIKF